MVLDKAYFKPLDDFFALKTIHDVNRDTYSICNLFDKANNICVSLVFLRDWDSLETDSFNQVIIEGKGAVFTFPCYWLSVPKELAYTYLTYIVQTFYDEYVVKWTNSANSNIGSNGDITSGTNNNNGCYCQPSCGLV